MRTAYLWDAGRWSGVAGSLGDAQAAAAEHAGDGVTARVEAARLATAVTGLQRVYERTGRAWTSRAGQGTVAWYPVMRREAS